MPKKLMQEKQSNFYILPIAFVITVIPLIVYLKIDTLSAIEIKNWYGEETYTDFFNYYKSQWLMIGTLLAVCFFFIHGMLKKLEIKKSFIYIPTFTYAGLIILSTLFSKNREIALSGFVARYEGMISLLCYLALMLVTFNLIKAESQIRFLLGALLISSVIIGIIGLFQLFGLDLYRTMFGKLLILPEAYHQYAKDLLFRFEDNFVYATFSNSNYVGSYMVLLIPITLISALCYKKPYLKISSFCLSILLVAVLFGSRSRAGWVGLAISIIVGIILFRKIVFRNKIVPIAALAGIIVLFFGSNAVMGGNLIKKVVSTFSQEDFYDLQDILFSNNAVTIVGSSENLMIKSNGSEVSFYDKQESELEYTMSEQGGIRTITFADQRYKDFILNIQDKFVTITQKQMKFVFEINNNSFSLIGVNNRTTEQINKPLSFGFEGKERFGSARGYIWSRSIPLLKNTIAVGYGPDTYAVVFPQEDYIGKIRAYGTAQVIVDKPHNLFLQISINTGVLSLIAFLVLIGFYLIQSFKLYLKDIQANFMNLTGAGIFLAICGYLSAGLFNDSVVGIAPLFWVFLGLGLANNILVKNRKLTN